MHLSDPKRMSNRMNRLQNTSVTTVASRVLILLRAGCHRNRAPSQCLRVQLLSHCGSCTAAKLPQASERGVEVGSRKRAQPDTISGQPSPVCATWLLGIPLCIGGSGAGVGSTKPGFAFDFLPRKGLPIIFRKEVRPNRPVRRVSAITSGGIPGARGGGSRSLEVTGSGRVSIGTISGLDGRLSGLSCSTGNGSANGLGIGCTRCCTGAFFAAGGSAFDGCVGGGIIGTSCGLADGCCVGSGCRRRGRVGCG